MQGDIDFDCLLGNHCLKNSCLFLRLASLYSFNHLIYEISFIFHSHYLVFSFFLLLLKNGCGRDPFA